ncbi:MAG: hypothetical protein WCB57_15750, partial [Pseudonocardiaceae bacterium]
AGVGSGAGHSSGHHLARCPSPPRIGPIRVGFARLIRRDTLLTHPPANLIAGLRVRNWSSAAPPRLAALCPELDSTDVPPRRKTSALSSRRRPAGDGP